MCDFLQAPAPDFRLLSTNIQNLSWIREDRICIHISLVSIYVFYLFIFFIFVYDVLLFDWQTATTANIMDKYV